MDMSTRPPRLEDVRKRTPEPNPQDALPPGTWLSFKGVRRFIPTDPTWKPTEGVDLEAESVFMKLTAEPPTIDVPNKPVHRHLCDCGCLLFGIENCPNCEWISRQKSAERSA
jgi:hypothetical protein